MNMTNEKLNLPKELTEPTTNPLIYSDQEDFERIMQRNFGINRGMFSILHIEGHETRYLNEHIQWLWVQYLKGEYNV